jgi:hypothetical protein
MAARASAEPAGWLGTEKGPLDTSDPLEGGSGASEGPLLDSLPRDHYLEL